MENESREPAMRVVLLRDSGWPEQPGVCCWRQAVRDAFTAANATVKDVTWRRPAPPLPNAPAPARTPRLAFLSPALRKPLAKAYGKSRRSLQRTSELLRPRPAPQAAPAGKPAGPRSLPGLENADLVIAETLEAARAAVNGGTPFRQVWALALPAQWLPAGNTTEYGTQLNRVADVIGGFLTDSELARESVERAVSTRRPRIEIFPPIAVDRRCDACADKPAVVERPTAEPVLNPETGEVITPEPPPAGPAQLELWRRLSIEQETGPLPYSFAAAKFRDLSSAWLPAERSGWGNGLPTTPMGMPSDGAPADWTTAAQRRGVEAVRKAVMPERPRTPRAPRKAMLAGFDLKFAVDLGERLDKRTDLEMSIDDWPGLARPTNLTEARMAESDSIFAEWARTSAIWMSERKRPDQFMAMRLHRFELDSPYPHEIVMENVDAVVYIAPLFGRRIRDELKWPLEKLLFIPNYMETEWLDRPKLPGAEFTLGFVGFEFIRKRFDLALDLLTEIRRTDPRFTMAVRGKMPWTNKYAWKDEEEREYVGWCFERIERDPLLRDAVTFHAPGRDMARWFRQVGFIISTSDEEGSHASVAEGMASGAVPIIRPWPGADELYHKDWVHATTSEAAAAVLNTAHGNGWAEQSARAKAEINRSHNPDNVVAAWADLLHGDVAGARSYFAEFSPL
ncbi:glycosyltransferase family protein [Micromonospora siamensis]|uniref:Glycosyl transferases group 1 n=1 Tax=Micromonospora siamensis TaxID=299152 RepID=A0A1C5HGM0_9ACTN|nr:hypothetical protein [Micromonospora siamensis]SCG45150.1 hypothetical protein GA0074704_1695 [Micromonospora siamensis]